MTGCRDRKTYFFLSLSPSLSLCLFLLFSLCLRLPPPSLSFSLSPSLLSLSPLSLFSYSLSLCLRRSPSSLFLPLSPSLSLPPSSLSPSLFLFLLFSPCLRLPPSLSFTLSLSLLLSWLLFHRFERLPVFTIIPRRAIKSGFVAFPS